eukprot:CAMPEP_0174912862 /NCGR_PEP_ID=MMETSP0167-20121228/80004_1 /TAXON_ID=38298 /ORGANISM="Rhodella maculata, Strain CCMP736" /LENGTH=527 /DNA_ID=CAMNT_0016157535 /DNA_START=1 /DNA_END=1582 /DNA_ORIENTATION=+
MTKHAGPVKRALLTTIEAFEQKGIKVNAVRFDREPAVHANRDYLERALPAGINLTAATETKPIAERSARTLKNTVRSIMADLPFTVPRKVIGELFKYAAAASTHSGHDASHEVPLRSRSSQAERPTSFFFSCDLVFINGVGALVSVAKPMQFIMTVPIMTKHVGPVKRALLTTIEAFEQKGIKVNALKFDREPAVHANRDYLECALPAGINLTAATEAEPIAERSACTLKNTVRSIMADLPFTVPRKVIGELFKYAARRVNTFGTRCLPRGTTPLEIFTGRKADMLVETRFAFGDYGQAHFGKVDNSMGERTTGCIALRPAGNAEGSWKFLNLSTDEVTTRQRFTAQPMPSEVIDRLSMTKIGQPLVEDDGEQSGGGRIVPAGGFEAIEAAATISIKEIEDEVATSSGRADACQKIRGPKAIETWSSESGEAESRERTESPPKPERESTSEETELEQARRGAEGNDEPEATCEPEVERNDKAVDRELMNQKRQDLIPDGEANGHKQNKGETPIAERTTGQPEMQQDD